MPGVVQATFRYPGPFKQSLSLGVVGTWVERSASWGGEYVARFLPELRSLEPFALLLCLVVLEQRDQLVVVPKTRCIIFHTMLRCELATARRRGCGAAQTFRILNASDPYLAK